MLCICEIDVGLRSQEELLNSMEEHTASKKAVFMCETLTNQIKCFYPYLIKIHFSKAKTVS